MGIIPFGDSKKEPAGLSCGLCKCDNEPLINIWRTEARDGPLWVRTVEARSDGAAYFPNGFSRFGIRAIAIQIENLKVKFFGLHGAIDFLHHATTNFFS